jgi:CDGSH-type Zn-finger protein
MQPKVVENLQNSKGESLSTVRGIALCRCGASKNKPFCDGTHSTINFSTIGNDKNNNHIEDKNILKDKKKSYIGQKITIHDNRSICSHAAYCVDNLSSVFKIDNRPWVNPNNASTEEIIETIKKCPSGALSYSVDGVEYKENEEREPMITVSKDGPYLITGGIELLGEKQISEGSSKEHYALCRCGASNNKLFCDGAHNKINFKDDKN